MTIRDFASCANNSVMIEVYKDEEKMCVFDSEFWEYESDEVLDLAVEKFTAESVVAKRPMVKISVAGDAEETEPGPEEPEPTYAGTVEALQSAFDDETVESIMLTDDIEITEPLVLSSCDKVLDLDRNEIKMQGTGTSFAIQANGKKLMITGNGTVDGGTSGDFNCCVVAVNDGEVVIDSGTFTCGAEEGNSSTTVYAETGDIYIYGGTFINQSWEGSTQGDNVVLNLKNNSGKYIRCYGGTFYDQNPAEGDDKDTATGSTFVADGFTVQETTDGDRSVFTVVSE